MSTKYATDASQGNVESCERSRLGHPLPTVGALAFAEWHHARYVALTVGESGK